MATDHRESNSSIGLAWPRVTTLEAKVYSNLSLILSLLIEISMLFLQSNHKVMEVLLFNTTMLENKTQQSNSDGSFFPMRKRSNNGS